MRFVRVTLVLWLTLLLLVGGIVFARLIDPSTSELESLGFTLCNDRLCFWGIAPGITSIENATKILAQHGAIKMPYRSNSYVLGNQHVKLGDSQAAAINLNLDDRFNKALPLELGNALGYLGPPCRIDFETFFDGHYLIILTYPYGEITASADQDFNLSWDLPVVNIYIFPPYASPDECRRGPPWIGFKSFSHYLKIWQEQSN